MRALHLDDMYLFARVAQRGTLSAVARERDVPVSQVSRTLARIGKACGARLIHRSTHGLSLTAEGQSFHGYCQRMLGTLDELEGEFAGKAHDASGLVRVAASTVIAQYQLVPSLAGLHARHPRLRVELEVGDRMLDIVRDAIDIAIRTVSHPPDTVVARQIGWVGRALYAAPAYLNAAGTPAHPDMAATMVLQGLGIGRLATLVGDALVRQKLLVPVLAPFVDPQPAPVFAITAVLVPLSERVMSERHLEIQIMAGRQLPRFMEQLTKNLKTKREDTVRA